MYNHLQNISIPKFNSLNGKLNNFSRSNSASESEGNVCILRSPIPSMMNVSVPRSPQLSQSNLNISNCQISFLPRNNEINGKGLLERILQKTVSMIYSPAHLVVLYILQDTNKMITEDEICEKTHIASSLIRRIIEDFELENFIISIYPKQEKKTQKRLTKKQKYGMCSHAIDYKSAIESITYKIMILRNEFEKCSEKEQSHFYECPIHKERMDYNTAMDYYFEECFVCPDCGREMEYICVETGNNVDKKRIEMIKTIENDLALLKNHFHHVNEYPTYIQQETMNDSKPKSEQRQNIATQYQKKSFDSDLMPWEIESEEEKMEMDDQTTLGNNGNSHTTSSSIDYLSFSFLPMNKTFTDNVETIDVVCQSPLQPRKVISFQPKKDQKGKRSNSTKPKIIQMM